MTGETCMIRRVSVRLSGVVVFVFGVVGCAKTDVQAPAKEAPSAPAAAPEVLEENQPAPPAPASAADSDRWPQAEARPGAPSQGAGGSQHAPAPILAPGPRDKADDAEKKKEPARSRAAAKPAKGELGASEGSASADEAQPALAVSESWTQLNLAFDGLTSALALSVPDCSAAERFRQNVCSLAEHICSLERDLPSTTPHNCGDGRTRCNDATSRYNAKCDR